MVMCFAPTCKHYSEKHSCKFFRFPKKKNVSQKWLQMIRRKDREPSVHSRICACHFVDGKSENGPTIFDFNVGKRFTESGIQPKRKRKSLEVPEIDEPLPGSSHAPQDLPGPSYVLGRPEDVVVPSEDEDMPSSTEEGQGEERLSPQLVAATKSENYFLKQEIDKLKTEMKALSLRFSFKHIEDNDHLISVYTGLPNKKMFLTLFDIFKNLNFTYFRGWQVVNIERMDQLLMTLMKLKLNLLNDDLGNRFGISRETVANIFKTWLFALHEILFKQLMKEVPSRHKNRLCMPSSFSSFTNCRIILDCTEVTTVHPKNMEKQQITYSSYKHKNTLKGLIGVAPNGVVTFVSDLYPGSTSDKRIVKHSGIIKQLVSGDLVLADKGFLIEELLPEGVTLNIPPFLCVPQFTPEQVILTRTIAKARIHVERAIRRVKSYTILDMVPATLIPHSSVVFQVCTALTNLQAPLIGEVQGLYEF